MAMTNLKNPMYRHTMSDNKLVKSLLDAATITGLAAGIGWIGNVYQYLGTDPYIKTVLKLKIQHAI